MEKDTAFLREFESQNQCELLFNLNVNLEKIGELKEEVRVLRQSTDTVQSLLQHTSNKISKMIADLQQEKAESEKIHFSVNAGLVSTRSQKTLAPNMVLKNLINAPIPDLEFTVFGQYFFVVINAPLVKQLKLPLIIYANFSVQPSKFYTLFADRDLCKFTWCKSTDKENWTECASTYKYPVTEQDVGHYLKIICEPCNSILTGPCCEAVSENKVDLVGTLPLCPFEERHVFTKTKLSGSLLRVVSYNVLSNRYTETDDAFSYCSPQFLAIDYRKQLISYNADVICLQEVDSHVYTSYYVDKFKSEGYTSYYHKKGNRIPEGLACFFNKSRLSKSDDRQIIYSEVIKQRAFGYLLKFVNANADLKDCFMQQKTSLHITVLKMKTNRKSHVIIVANTHLFYKPTAELVRLVQINVATTFLQTLVHDYSKKGSSVKVVLCGDFNSVPSSAVFEFLTTGKIPKTHRIFAKCTNVCDLFHNFGFQSACGVPKYTNYTDDFKDCLDYIFVQKSFMKVRNMVPFPKEEDLAKFEGLPSEVYPSDHLALIVDLEIIK